MSDSEKTAFDKRVRRTINGRRHVFFAVTSPGLENLCLEELENLGCGISDFSVIPGGVEFESDLKGLYTASFHLRTATRILMRVAEFSASSFAELEKKIIAINWEIYLPQGCKPEISVKCSKCRLYHSDAIAVRVSGWIASKTAGVDRSTIRQQIFIRGINDRFVVSVNTSGESLYKRGIKTGFGKAPIRETLASAMLFWAGYRPGMTLVDPMCGTGTFSMEAAMISKEIPAGFFRNFAFMEWPSFMPKTWSYMLSEAGKKIVELPGKIIFASDTDSELIKNLKQNIEKWNLYDSVETDLKNIFDIGTKKNPGKKGLVAINPPYGKRLGNKYDGRDFFVEICAMLANDFKGWRLAVIAPEDFFHIRLPFGNRRFHDVVHGGLRLKVLTAII